MNLTERLSVKVEGIKLKSRARRAADENPTLEQLVEQFIKAAAKKANLATEWVWFIFASAVTCLPCFIVVSQVCEYR